MKPIVFLFLFITSSISYAEWEFYFEGDGKFFITIKVSKE